MEYIESVTYDADTAKNNTLLNFPLPMAVFSLNDSRVIWANQIFFNMCGVSGSRFEARLDELVPTFSGKWLLEGKTQYPGLLAMGGRKYQIHGNIIRPAEESAEPGHGYMGIAYWVDVTEYDDIRIKYEETRPVIATIVIDNYDELVKNHPDRIKNDLRDAVEDSISQWCDGKDGFLRRYDRDRYVFIFEERWLAAMKAEKFALLEQVHSVVSPSGIHATISIGVGHDGSGFEEDFQFSSLAAEMALSRGGDQAVVKNRFNFEFFGGRGSEVETRTKVKSRVMANALAELIADSSRVFVMGHKFADLDAVGSAVAVCCIARKKGKLCRIVIDPVKNSSAAAHRPAEERAGVQKRLHHPAGGHAPGRRAQPARRRGHQPARAGGGQGPPAGLQPRRRHRPPPPRGDLYPERRPHASTSPTPPRSASS